MKTKSAVIYVAAWGLAAPLGAQTPAAVAGVGQALNPTNGPAGRSLLPAGPWQRPAPFTWLAHASGQVAILTNEVRTESHGWARPTPRLRIHEGGATGSFPGAEHTLEVRGNLNHAEAVVMNLPGQVQLRGHAVAVGLQDEAGHEALLGLLQDCAGEVDEAHPNVVRWPNAFSGLKADVLLIYGLTYIEQLVVLRENPPIPSDIDPASARLFVLSEFWQAPEPRRERRALELRPDPAVARQWGAAVAPDEVLDWGWMSMRMGKAFAWPATAEGSGRPSVPTAKAWQKVGPRLFLREVADYQSLKPALDGLAAVPGARRHERLAQRLPPPLPAQTSQHPLRLAKATPRGVAAGVVLDWMLQNSALINVDFNSYGDKQGWAATGRSATDYWNVYSYPYQTLVTLNNLAWHSGVASPVGLVVSNAPGQWAFATTDLMYDGYVYPWNSGNIGLAISGLPAGFYDFYFYGHGAANNQNSQFQLATAQGFQGSKFTANSASWQPSGPGFWVEGLQYVAFNSIQINAGGAASVTVLPDASSYAVLNGLQIAAWNQSPVASAGPDQSIVLPGGASLNGTAQDDYYPPNHSLALSWSKVSGPGTVSFSPPSGTGAALASAATFATAGVYGLRFTADDSQMPGANDLLVTVNPPNIPGRDTAWVEDAVPRGAVQYADADTWGWIASGPSPLSGNQSHQSLNATGLHQHYFINASQALAVNAGDWLFCYVYLEADKLPSQIMLQWLASDGTWWNHRAYWGTDCGLWTPSTRVGSLPATGRWVRLTAPASAVDLEGRTVIGMAFTLYHGRAAWDLAGKGTGHGFADTDLDGLRDSDEVYIFHTDPNLAGNTDSNGNGLPDVWESYFFGNLDQSGAGDWDGDGLSNAEALRKALDPTAALGLNVFTPLK